MKHLPEDAFDLPADFDQELCQTPNECDGAGRCVHDCTALIKLKKDVVTESSAVDRPDHYTRFKIEPIYFIMENNLPFWAGNVVKYTLRYDAKNGIEDLKKARRYLDIQIKKMEGNPRYSE